MKQKKYRLIFIWAGTRYKSKIEILTDEEFLEADKAIKGFIRGDSVMSLILDDGSNMYISSKIMVNAVMVYEVV